MNDYEKIEEEAVKKLKPEKPKMKVSGKSIFLLEKQSLTNDKKALPKRKI